MRTAAYILLAIIAFYFLSVGPVIAHYANAEMPMPRIMRYVYHPLVNVCPDATAQYLSFWNIDMIEAYFRTYPQQDYVEEGLFAIK
jgi:hypothetical protein